MITAPANQRISPQQRSRGLLLILALGLAMCCWQLGSTGLVDETPPLFAAAGRAMARTGDWLTPSSEWIAQIRQTAPGLLADGAGILDSCQ